jgi:hypothetical protein
LKEVLYNVFSLYFQLKEEVKMKKGKCCDGQGIVAHLLLVAGTYVLSWGLIGSVSVGVVLRSPVFWGLILILAGCCGAVHKMK